jgi:hypothetical protein
MFVIAYLHTSFFKDSQSKEFTYTSIKRLIYQNSFFFTLNINLLMFAATTQFPRMIVSYVFMLSFVNHYIISLPFKIVIINYHPVYVLYSLLIFKFRCCLVFIPSQVVAILGNLCHLIKRYPSWSCHLFTSH